MNKTYLFYDIETTGLNPCFDQVLQFAAIRTDLELRELTRHEITVRLNGDVTPAPGAIITHHIGISESQKGITELAAMTAIHQLLNMPGTISLGYNTLGFDDEFLRFSFYRNLLPPYTHQFAQGCSRMDLYPLTILYYLFKPDVLPHWPQHNQQISLKLEYLSAANQLAQGPAHTAMVDVEATLALARKFFQKRDIWKYATSYFDKDSDLARIQQPEALMINSKFGARSNYLAPVLALGQHCQYRNQTLWLRLDGEKIGENPMVIRKKVGENELLLPMKPTYLEKLTPERRQTVQKNRIWLQENPQIFSEIRAYHLQYTYPPVPEIDADAALYELGFPTRAEESLMSRFHQAPISEKMQIAEQFPNPVRKQQALRIMGRHFFAHLTAQEQARFGDYLEKTLYSTAEQAPIDYRQQRKLTIPTARAELLSLQAATLSPQQQILLTELQNYYEKLISRRSTLGLTAIGLNENCF